MIKKIIRLIKEKKLRFAVSKKFADKLMPFNLRLIDMRMSKFLKNLDLTNSTFQDIPNNIFFFWYDGIDAMPLLAKKCYEKLIANYSQTYKIIFVDKTNIEKLTNMDPYFLEMLNTQKISIQMFSDILRFNLLKTIGGYWVDSSLYFYSNSFNFKQLLINRNFNSVENKSIDHPFIQYSNIHSRWCSFILAGKKDNIVSKVYLQSMKYYLSKYKHAPYLLIDILITLFVKYNNIQDYKSFGLNQIHAYTLTNFENINKNKLNKNAIDQIKNEPQKLINSTDISAKTKNGIFYELLIDEKDNI